MLHLRMYPTFGEDVQLTLKHESLELRKDVWTEGLEFKVVCISMLIEGKKKKKCHMRWKGVQRKTMLISKKQKGREENREDQHCPMLL